MKDRIRYNARTSESQRNTLFLTSAFLRALRVLRGCVFKRSSLRAILSLGLRFSFYILFFSFWFPRQVVALEGGRTFFTTRPDKLDDSAIVVEEGVGFNGIVVGDPSCNQKFIKEKLGEPNTETEQRLDYNRKYGFDFSMRNPKSPVSEIRLNRRFKGKLSSAITLHSSMADVFKAYGEPITEQIVTNPGPPHFENRVLYKGAQGNAAFNVSKIFYNENGLLFWFRHDQIMQIVVIKKKRYASPEKSQDIVVEEGVGFEGIVIGDPQSTIEFIKSKFGAPDEEMDQWLDYVGQYGFAFETRASGGPIMYIKLVRGFGGRLSSGISIDSKMEDVFRIYGEPLATEDVAEFGQDNRDRVLYRNNDLSRISYNEKGVKFRFDGSLMVAIIIFKRGTEGYYIPAYSGRHKNERQIETAMQRLLPRWVPQIKIPRILNRVKRLHVGRYFLIICFLILCLVLKKPMMRLYWRWRPVPEGKLVVIQDPSGQQMESIALGQAAKLLKKRRLVIGSGEQADIRLRHKSVDYLHAAVSARKAERVVITYIEQMGDGLLSVNGARGGVMILGRNADVQIGEFQFRYEKPTD